MWRSSLCNASRSGGSGSLPEAAPNSLLGSPVAPLNTLIPRSRLTSHTVFLVSLNSTSTRNDGRVCRVFSIRKLSNTLRYSTNVDASPARYFCRSSSAHGGKALRSAPGFCGVVMGSGVVGVCCVQSKRWGFNALVSCPANSLHIRPRLHIHDCSGNPRGSTGYRCGFRLALGAKPSVTFHAAICGTGRQFRVFWWVRFVHRLAPASSLQVAPWRSRCHCFGAACSGAHRGRIPAARCPGWLVPPGF